MLAKILLKTQSTTFIKDHIFLIAKLLSIAVLMPKGVKTRIKNQINIKTKNGNLI